MSLEPHTHDLPDELGENVSTHDSDRNGLAPRQRGSLTDPSMRDGNSSHGNPYEGDPDEITTDNDTGDVAVEPVGAGFDGGASEGTPAELRADMDTDGDDFSLGAREEPADADLLDGDTDDVAGEDLTGRHMTAAAPDPLPHPQVDAGRDGSTVGGNEPTHAPRLPTAPAPADEGTTAEVDLPIENYADLKVTEIVEKADSLTPDQLRQVRDFEAAHRNRKTLVTKLDRLLGGGRRRSRKAKAESNGHAGEGAAESEAEPAAAGDEAEGS
jgi:hypothetical protein